MHFENKAMPAHQDKKSFSQKMHRLHSNLYTVNSGTSLRPTTFRRDKRKVRNINSDVVLESGNVLESDSSPYFEDSDSDSDSNP